MFQQLSLLQFMQQGGFILLFLGVCSIASIAVIIERFIIYRAVLGKRKKLYSSLSTLLAKKKISEATKLLSNKRSMLGDLYLSIIKNKDNPREITEEIVQRHVLKILLVLERKLNFLASLGSVTPFVGLFGTVFGIIKTFRGMSFSSSYSPSMVTSGIAEALLNTAAGLFVAIPAVIAFNYFSHQIQIFLRQIEISTSEMIEWLSNNNGIVESEPQPELVVAKRSDVQEIFPTPNKVEDKPKPPTNTTSIKKKKGK